MIPKTINEWVIHGSSVDEKILMKARLPLQNMQYEHTSKTLPHPELTHGSPQVLKKASLPLGSLCMLWFHTMQEVPRG